MLAGLEYAHNLADFDGSPLQIVHRDVSPQNVFITFDGQVKLLDFGIAKASDSMHETHAGVVKGKVSYMSPEQGRGNKVDARADVFSAGVLLWEALTGKRMRETKNEQEKIWELVSADVPRASTVRPSVPPELDRICAQAMVWDRNDRYASASAMHHDLERYLTATGTNVSAREVGGCVTELFREDRANTNAVIEAHVARARGGAGRDKLPIIDVASRSGVGSPTPSDERRSRSRPNEVGQETSLDVPSAKQAGGSGIVPSEPRGIHRTSHSRLLIPGVAVAGAITVAFFFLIARPSHEAGLGVRADDAPRMTGAQPPTSPPAPPLATTRPLDPAPIAKPSVIDVEIRVSPETATVSIDGEEVGGSSFVRQYVSDYATHQIRAAAPGYVTKSLAVVFSTNITLDLSLERVKPARPVARAAPPVRTPPRSHPVDPAHPPGPSGVRQPPADPVPTGTPNPAGQPADVDPAGGITPRRPIDPHNPYGGRE
jgi:serine/threonine-protein kinase